MQSFNISHSVYVIPHPGSEGFSQIASWGRAYFSSYCIFPPMRHSPKLVTCSLWITSVLLVLAINQFLFPYVHFK